MGTADLLFPPGVERIDELPAQLFEAIRVSMIYLSFEELPEEDRPPKKIWDDSAKLKLHFQQVKEKRKRQSDPDAAAPIEEPVQNDLTKHITR